MTPGHEGSRLPRRELFDIRAQLMAEEEMSGISPKLAIGLSSDDITPRVYEGGFKTWECCVDLAQYLEQLVLEGYLELRGREVQIVEVRDSAGVPPIVIRCVKSIVDSW